MDNKTLFNAYEKTRDRMDNIRARRVAAGMVRGILIGKDELAQEYQRYYRLRNRIKYRVNGISVCPVCAHRMVHAIDCPRRSPRLNNHCHFP